MCPSCERRVDVELRPRLRVDAASRARRSARPSSSTSRAAGRRRCGCRAPPSSPSTGKSGISMLLVDVAAAPRRGAAPARARRAARRRRRTSRRGIAGRGRGARSRSRDRARRAARSSATSLRAATSCFSRSRAMFASAWLGRPGLMTYDISITSSQRDGTGQPRGAQTARLRLGVVGDEHAIAGEELAQRVVHLARAAEVFRDRDEQRLRGLRRRATTAIGASKPSGVSGSSQSAIGSSRFANSRMSSARRRDPELLRHRRRLGQKLLHQRRELEPREDVVQLRAIGLGALQRLEVDVEIEIALDARQLAARDTPCRLLSSSALRCAAFLICSRFS